jgi:hypothetical protein
VDVPETLEAAAAPAPAKAADQPVEIAKTPAGAKPSRRSRKPKPEPPVAEAPPADAPVVETLAVDAPVVEAPAVDAPVVEAPAVDVPAVETPLVEAPAAEAAAVPAPIKKAAASNSAKTAAKTAIKTSAKTPAKRSAAVSAPVLEAPAPAATPVASPPAVELGTAAPKRTAKATSGAASGATSAGTKATPKQGTRTPPAPRTLVPVPADAPEIPPIDPAAPSEATVVAAPAIPRKRGRIKPALVLIVLLLAAAVGLGTAAVVLTRTPTWESTTVVQLVTGAGTTLATRGTDVTTYEQQLAGRDFSTETAAGVGVKRSVLRAPIAVKDVGNGKIRMVVRASNAGDAKAVATAAADSLVRLVLAEQSATTSRPEETVSASIAGPASGADRLEPSTQDAVLAGGLAGGAVLLVGAALVALRRGKKV